MYHGSATHVISDQKSHRKGIRNPTAEKNKTNKTNKQTKQKQK
jgi:hypothetical protein